MTAAISTLAQFITDEAFEQTQPIAGQDRSIRLAAMLDLIARGSMPGLTIEALEVEIIRACRAKVGLPCGAELVSAASVN